VTDPSRSAAGGHDIPSVFAGGAAAHRRLPARNRRRLIPVLVAVAVCIAGVAAAQVAGSAAFDSADAAFSTATDALAADAQDLRGELQSLETTVAAARGLTDRSPAPLTDPAALAALTAAVQETATVAENAASLVDQEVPERKERPFWFWDLFAAAAQLGDARDEVDALDAELVTSVPSVHGARAAVADAGVVVLSATASAASSFEAAHVSAGNDEIAALRAAALDVASLTSLDPEAAAAFGALQDAAARVLSSEQAELAEKAGPLLSSRLEVEAFARSLAPGVLLEFDWSPVVNGAGTDGSMGGLTTWWWDDPDRAQIQLSDSVAERWPSSSSKSLVAHEVGHAISVKCEGMYDASTQDSIEKWATAWAIGMGYTDDANGVWAYGYPPQSYIDAASACR
jgi:hypothetical protein